MRPGSKAQGHWGGGITKEARRNVSIAVGSAEMK